MVLVPFTMYPPLATPSDALLLSPMDLPPVLYVFPTLPLRSIPLLGVCLGSPLVSLVSGLPSPLGGAACRFPPSGLSCDSSPPCWVVSGVPWPVDTTTVFCSTLPLSGLPLSATQSLSPLYSPYVSCPPQVMPESFLSSTIVLIGLPDVSTSETSYVPLTSRFPLKYTSPSPMTGVLVS